ncbi:hypothetical protein [Nocardiopsis chromatogenes]|uniref:hypothetical protein n=1 Tax=Nocardiopsis chromatogenes TaxID=280239 RepID=UPI000349D18B|nr:hypothetical protein [Nocardiopsis chromatogenes]
MLKRICVIAALAGAAVTGASLPASAEEAASPTAGAARQVAGWSWWYGWSWWTTDTIGETAIGFVEELFSDGE